MNNDDKKKKEKKIPYNKDELHDLGIFIENDASDEKQDK
jgi:hypothetical protein